MQILLLPLLMASGHDNGLRLRPNFAEAEAAAASSIGKLQILKKESSHPGRVVVGLLLCSSTKERKKKKVD